METESPEKSSPEKKVEKVKKETESPKKSSPKKEQKKKEEAPEADKKETSPKKEKKTEVTAVTPETPGTSKSESSPTETQSAKKKKKKNKKKNKENETNTTNAPAENEQKTGQDKTPLGTFYVILKNLNVYLGFDKTLPNYFFLSLHCGKRMKSLLFWVSFNCFHLQTSFQSKIQIEIVHVVAKFAYVMFMHTQT